ncbi:hypothetical protein SKAU_G00184050 [Synaphobranchus kaupii]|uniref:Uncharacterized protein n=1 Tax=Synaphobranchus kaupii TaxID=118154 RepID=A0A9Q1FCE6_SYNKA|nr:hypothetical protein SKAU_G00184050 [Synaphobranchus kaupii]
MGCDKERYTGGIGKVSRTVALERRPGFGVGPGGDEGTYRTGKRCRGGPGIAVETEQARTPDETSSAREKRALTNTGGEMHLKRNETASPDTAKIVFFKRLNLNRFPPTIKRTPDVCQAGTAGTCPPFRQEIPSQHISIRHAAVWGPEQQQDQLLIKNIPLGRRGQPSTSQSGSSSVRGC